MLFIISDIFGRTNALETLCKDLQEYRENQSPIVIVDPYSDAFEPFLSTPPTIRQRHPQFPDEQAAYQCFTDTIGLPAYASKLEQTLKRVVTKQEKVELLGFSAGAAAMWQVISQTSHHCPVKNVNFSKATGFYGSQIRHLTNRTSKVPCNLIFPESEPHFSTKETATRLLEHQSQQVPGDLLNSPLQVEFTTYRHGFMNRLSKNFNEKGYWKYVSRLGKAEV